MSVQLVPSPISSISPGGPAEPVGLVGRVARVARPASLPASTDRLVVVEASAGTGKTYFLEHRVVDLILAGAELGQLLLVTFTEKAVAELRMRIRDLLDRLARTETDSPGELGTACWQIDDAARKRLRAAVTAFDHAPIFTIHGFCHRILVEDAFAARRLFDQTQVADEVAFDAALDVLLRERFARVHPDRDLLSAYLQTGKTVDALRKLLLGCARTGAELRRHLDPETARAAAAGLFLHLGTEDQRAALVAPIKNGNHRRYVSTWLDEIGASLDASDPTAPTPQLLALVDGLRDTLEKLHAKIGEIGASGAGMAALVTALGPVLHTPSLDEALAADLLPQIVARIGRDKAEAGMFDYDDMLALVWEALEGPRSAELAARLRARTPWAMIDEFQDTDPVQWNIFRTVWMHPEARGLTIVGDPKQAIYGFRGADIATYVAAREEMLRCGATRVALDVNRRSTEPLVHAVNHILIGNLGLPLLDPGSDPTRGIGYDEPVKPSGDVVCGDPRPPITVFELQAKGSSETRRDAISLAIGVEVERLRAAPPAWTSRGVAQPFALGQVMVLTRSNRDSLEIATALRGRGLACALVEPERLFGTREATELANVLAAIAEPRERSPRLRALRTRFFDVPWAELARVVDGPDHHPQIAQIFDWAQLASKRAYEALFRRIVEDSRFAERALILGGGERALTNTWHLIELLLAEVARSRSDLHELVTQLRRWIEDDVAQADERDVQRAETDVDAIRILTIHKAKGLEAPYVFMFGGTGAAPNGTVHTLRDATGRALVVGTPDANTKKLLEAEADAENQRLAYVALTRAQVRLYLPLYADKSLVKSSAYVPIQTCLAASVANQRKGGGVPGAPLFELHPVVLGDDEVPPAPSDALADFQATPPPAIVELSPLAPARTGLTVLSYTRLAHDLDEAAIAARPGDILAIDPAEFDMDDTAGEVAPTDLPPGASAGLLLHDVLEIADLEVLRRAPDLAAWAGDPTVRQQVADAARTRGISRDHLPHAYQLIHHALAAPLELIDGTTLPPLARATALAREVEFAYPLPPGATIAPGRGLVRGFIDALVAYDDELWVLDYKSDLLAVDDLARAAAQRVKENYAVQARLYAIAADRMRGHRRLAGLLFQFVRHHVVVPVRIADDTLAGWTHWLANLPAPGLAPEPRGTP